MAEVMTAEHPEPKQSTVRQLHGTAVRCAKPGCLRPLYRMNDDAGEWLLNSRVQHPRMPGGGTGGIRSCLWRTTGAANLLALCIAQASKIGDTPQHYPAACCG
jgi:hypothetical protein